MQLSVLLFFFFKQKTAYDMRISDWSSDVCSSDLVGDEPVIVKNHINSFRETDLKQQLDAKGVEEVVVVGAMSHMCIDAVVRAAVDMGYPTTVLHDACATLDLSFNGVTVPAPHVHAAMMAAFEIGYGTVKSTQAYLTAE